MMRLNRLFMGLGAGLLGLPSFVPPPRTRVWRSPNTYQPNGPRECARRVRQAEAIAAKRRKPINETPADVAG